VSAFTDEAVYEDRNRHTNGNDGEINQSLITINTCYERVILEILANYSESNFDGNIFSLIRGCKMVGAESKVFICVLCKGQTTTGAIRPIF
jgi:hypothetical protein